MGALHVFTYRNMILSIWSPKLTQTDGISKQLKFAVTMISGASAQCPKNEHLVF